MQNLKKHLATILTILLISSMAITLNLQSFASAEVINGINYNDATATAIKAGMHWDINANASSYSIVSCGSDMKTKFQHGHMVLFHRTL